MTEKLYFDDSYLLVFEAKVCDAREAQGKAHVLLEKTCFYPTSGGQPCDYGTIDGRPVIDVYVAPEGIVHVVEGAAPCGTVRCEVEAARRLDHMQQHTGQHILSQSIYRHLAAGTESLHIGATSSTIDIPVKRLSDTDVGIIEQGANTIVFSDIPIRTYEVGELDETYRKSSSLEGPLRIVEVEGFDKTPCGGTHCRRTGEVGLIKITDYYKKGVFWRIEFVCGGRALARMQSYGSILRRLTALLNVPQEAVPDKVSALLEGMKDAERARDALKDGMAASTLQSCVDSASKVGGVAICTAIVDDAVVAQKMGKLATEMSMTVCIVGAPTDKGPQMVVSASPDSGYNAKELIVPALDALGGKGGGSPQFASGRGADNTLLEQAVAAARLRATEGP